MLKKLGKSLLASKEEKSVVNVSLPVYVFEPRSYLQRLTDNWCYLPEMFKKAADILYHSFHTKKPRILLAYIFFLTFF